MAEAPRTGDGLFPGEVIEVEQVRTVGLRCLLPSNFMVVKTRSSPVY